MAKGNPSKPHTRDQEARRILKRLKKEGWRIEHGTRHTRAYPPEAPGGEAGWVTILPKMKQNRNWQNMLADVKRRRRAAQALVKRGA